MNRLLILLLSLLGTAQIACAQSVEEQYVRIYNLIQQADALRASGDDPGALPKYLEASTALQQMQKIYPSWNPKVVNYRIKYVGDKIAAIPQARPTSPVVVMPDKPAGATSAPPTTTTPTTQADPGAEAQQLAALRESLRQLQSEKTILEAKLKEALATQPAAIDPRELTKAQDQIQSLLKENELLKTGLEQEKNRPAAMNAKELEDARRMLVESGAQLTEQRAANEKLVTEKNALQEQLGKGALNAEAMAALRAENELLKKQLADTKVVLSPEQQATDVGRKLAEAEARIATMTSDTEVLRLEKIALESRLKKVLATPAAKSATVSRDVDAQRIKELERQRDELLKRLEGASEASQSSRTRDLMAKVDQLTREVTTLKSKVEVFEARAIPYSVEELALFQQSKPKPKPAPALVAEKETKPVDGRKSVKELPTGTVALVAKAEKHFAAKEYSQAEEDYLTILRQDENNAYSLANLGAIQMEMGRLDEAEKHITRALEVSPDDAHAVSLLGYLKFRQQKYDEAIVALNRAAKLNPQNADIQNYLGVTLSHKGLRGPAEQAFRKAVVLDPNHGGAQNNLAVFYASENPPNVPLARFHYQKAVATGHLRSAELEKLFEKKEAAAQ
jgi:tetratricopeptide (TPR) repeat protein